MRKKQWAALYNDILKDLSKERQKDTAAFVAEIGQRFAELTKTVTEFTPDDEAYGRLRRELNQIKADIASAGDFRIMHLYRKEYNTHVRMLKLQHGFETLRTIPKMQNLANLRKRYKSWTENLYGKFEKSFQARSKLMFYASSRFPALDTVDDPKVFEKFLNELYVGGWFEGIRDVVPIKKWKQIRYVKLRRAGMDKASTYIASFLKEELKSKYINVSNNPEKPWFMNAKLYAECWIMDMHTDMANQTTMDLLNDAELDLVIFPKTPDCCDLCRALVDGKTFSVSGKSKKYPMLTFSVPGDTHPRCQHHPLPYHESFGDPGTINEGGREVDLSTGEVKEVKKEIQKKVNDDLHVYNALKKQKELPAKPLPLDNKAITGFFEKKLLDKTFQIGGDKNLGEITFEQGQFFRLIAGGQNKGFVEKASSPTEAYDMIKKGLVGLSNKDIEGFAGQRARGMSLIPDLLSSPDLVLSKPFKDGVNRLLLYKNYKMSKKYADHYRMLALVEKGKGTNKYGVLSYSFQDLENVLKELEKNGAKIIK